jgi:BMFP domain-containing protein YqiC
LDLVIRESFPEQQHLFPMAATGRDRKNALFARHV